MQDDRLGTQEIQMVFRTNKPLTGTATVATAGTRVQLSSDQPCQRVHITAYEGNTGTIVVGDVNCVAAAATMRGRPLYATQGDWFYVPNLNQLYIDATANTQKVSWYAEI